MVLAGSQRPAFSVAASAVQRSSVDEEFNWLTLVPSVYCESRRTAVSETISRPEINHVRCLSLREILPEFLLAGSKAAGLPWYSSRAHGFDMKTKDI
jgi:allantoicase